MSFRASRRATSYACAAERAFSQSLDALAVTGAIVGVADAAVATGLVVGAGLADVRTAAGDGAGGGALTAVASGRQHRRARRRRSHHRRLTKIAALSPRSNRPNRAGAPCSASSLWAARTPLMSAPKYDCTSRPAAPRGMSRRRARRWRSCGRKGRRRTLHGGRRRAASENHLGIELARAAKDSDQP